jgi:hypothetical protein
VNILQALDDASLFRGMFDERSWRPWRAFLAALFGLPLDDDALALFRHHTGRTAPPAKPFRTATLVCGRRGGKSRVLAVVATFLATIPDHTPFLAPGETPVIAVIARDRDQAGVIFSYIRGLLRAVPALGAMIEDALAESITLANGVVVEIHTASIGAPRGRTFLAVLMDEVAYWPTGEVAQPDGEVVNAVRPGLSTIPYSLLLIASSPYARRGVLYEHFARWFGKDDAPILVWRGTTEEMNSNLIGDDLIAEMYATDPDRAAAEFGAQFRSDIVAFISREAVEGVVAPGMTELPPGGGIVFQGFTDPSGGSADSFTLAIGHMGSDGVAVLDALRETRPPFSPDGVVQEYAALLKAYGISRVTGDAYAGEWPRERFAVHGITYEVSKRNKNAIYAALIPALNGHRVQLLDQPRLIGQLCALERRTARGGRDSIDHAPGSNDDVANAAAGVLVEVIGDRRPALVRSNDMLVNGAPVPLPRCDLIIAILAADQHGGCAATFWAYSPHGAVALVLIDFETSPLSMPFIDSILPSLRRFGGQCNARDMCLWTTLEPLARIAAGRGLHAEVVPLPLIADPARLAIAAAGHAMQGRVKIASPAHERAETSPLKGALDLRAGDAADASPLRMSLLAGIAVCLDDSSQAAAAA